MDISIKVPTEHARERLDRYLACSDTDRSRSAWQRLIRDGKVLVNGGPASPDYALKADDLIELLPETPTPEKEIVVPDIPILYEDEDVIVLDKPAGVISQRAATSGAPAVTDFLEAHHPGIKAIGEEEQKSGLVHRLDRDTSGVMLAAKNQAAFAFLKDKFKRHDLVKTYTALVYGRIEPAEGKIDLSIGRDPHSPCRQTVARNPERASFKSRPALTLYRTLEKFEGFTLLSIEIKTGRMHQIRVHMKAIGHPVAGDAKYASPGLLAGISGLDRQFLHASSLEIGLPNGKTVAFRSALPADLTAFLGNLRALD